MLRLTSWACKNVVPLVILLAGLALYVLAANARLPKSALDYLRSNLSWLSWATEPTVWRDFSLALMTAGIATLSIESVRLREFITRLADHITRHTEEIARFVKKATEVGFLQYDWALHLDFERVENNPSFVKFRFDQEYKIKNLAPTERGYVVQHIESRDWDDHPTGFETRIRYVRAKYVDTEKWEFEWKENDSNSGDRYYTKDPSYVQFKRPVRIKGDGVLCVYEGSVKLMRDREFEVIFVKIPTRGVRASVEYPDDMVIDFWAWHPKSDLSKTPVQPEKLGDKRLKLDWDSSLMFDPYMIIGVEWRKTTN